MQAADVGVGIMGKEGRQAVNNADFAISQFRYAHLVFLCHISFGIYGYAHVYIYTYMPFLGICLPYRHPGLVSWVTLR